MDVKVFFAALPDIINMVDTGLTLSGKKNERVSKYLELAEKLSIMIAGSFALATAKGEAMPGVARVGEPLRVETERGDERTEVLEALHKLAAYPEVAKIVDAREPGEGGAAPAFALPDFGPLRFLPIAEFGIRALLKLAEELRARKQRNDAGKVRSVKPKPKAKSVKAKSKGKK